AGADEAADEAISRISPAHTDRRSEGGLVLPQVRVQARGQDRFDVGVQGKGAWIARATSRPPSAASPAPVARFRSAGIRPAFRAGSTLVREQPRPRTRS